jgi:hypothetical protein
MSNLTVVTYVNFKFETYFCDSEDDLFNDQSESVWLCSESDFEKWLKSQRLMIKRYASELEKPINEICLPENMWMFFKKHYCIQKKTSFLMSNFPASGFFEAINDEKGKVACLLPEPSSAARYRVSLYRDTGPIRHIPFNDRDEAVSYIAKQGYKLQDGALDALVGTDDWNRGVYICKWISEGIFPIDGIEQNKDNPEIQRLFKH